MHKFILGKNESKEKIALFFHIKQENYDLDEGSKENECWKNTGLTFDMKTHDTTIKN